MEIETELFVGRSDENKTIKFPFFFLAAPPTPPAENGLVRKFLVLVCDRREREARTVRFTTQSERTIWERATTRSARALVIKILRILLIQCSNFVQKTPPIYNFSIFRDFARLYHKKKQKSPKYIALYLKDTIPLSTCSVVLILLK
jgi:hypothetical protein